MAGSLTTATAAEIEVCEPRFRSFVPGNALLETLAQGYRWLEGPVWFADHQVLLVSDIPNDRILRLTEAGEATVFRHPAGYPNGQTRDREGRLLTCSHLHRAVFRTELDGRVVTLVDRYRGKRLNAPNDIVVRCDGTVWFTDPCYGIETDYEGIKQASELPPAVYCFDPRDGRLTVVADDFEGPNGLCFSPAGDRLYISETGDQFAADTTRHIRAFEVVDAAPGAAHLAGGGVFHKITPGYADGFRCDSEGNVWSSAGDGVHCLAPGGDLLGRIRVPHAVSNLCFGGHQRSRLFLCAGDAVYSVAVNRRGCQYCCRYP